MDENVFGIWLGGKIYSRGTFHWTESDGTQVKLHRGIDEGPWACESTDGLCHNVCTIHLPTEQAQAYMRGIESRGFTVAHDWHDAPIHEATVADEAMAAVTGPRMKAYGPPEENFARWSAMCKAMGYDLGRDDLCKIMLALKLARFANGYHRDSLVDLCGFSLIAERFNERP